MSLWDFISELSKHIHMKKMAAARQCLPSGASPRDQEEETVWAVGRKRLLGQLVSGCVTHHAVRHFCRRNKGTGFLEAGQLGLAGAVIPSPTHEQFHLFHRHVPQSERSGIQLEPVCRASLASLLSFWTVRTGLCSEDQIEDRISKDHGLNKSTACRNGSD